MSSEKFKKKIFKKLGEFEKDCQHFSTGTMTSIFINSSLFFPLKAAVTTTNAQQPQKIFNSIAKTMATIHMARPTSPYASSSSDTDSIVANVPTGTALRRLYFKTAKSSKMINPNTKSSSAPKVIVMNSSCNSTINTSTESASTHFTNITSTTDTETCDSLDLGTFEIVLN